MSKEAIQKTEIDGKTGEIIASTGLNLKALSGKLDALEKAKPQQLEAKEQDFWAPTEPKSDMDREPLKGIYLGRHDLPQTDPTKEPISQHVMLCKSKMKPGKTVYVRFTGSTQLNQDLSQLTVGEDAIIIKYLGKAEKTTGNGRKMNKYEVLRLKDEG